MLSKILCYYSYDFCPLNCHLRKSSFVCTQAKKKNVNINCLKYIEIQLLSPFWLYLWLYILPPITTKDKHAILRYDWTVEAASMTYRPILVQEVCVCARARVALVSIPRVQCWFMSLRLSLKSFLLKKQIVRLLYQKTDMISLKH